MKWGVPISVLAFLLFTCGVGSVCAQETPSLEQSSTWRIEFANDAVFDSDNQFTNGFALQKHSALAPSLEETGGTAAFGKALARVFLPNADGLNYREAWSFGQNMQTPEDKESPDLVLDDVPYLGMLAWSSSFIAFDDRRLTGFGWLVGVVGPASLAEGVQKAVHKITPGTDPLGWANQLDNEPVLSLIYTRKRKIWRGRNFDAALAFNGSLSNFITYGELAVEMRLGRLPQGFTYVPDPIGHGLHYQASLPRDSGTAFYVSFIARGTGLAVDMLREGNTFVNDNPWTELNTIEPEDFVAQGFLVLNLERPEWALRMSFWKTTDTVKKESLTPRGDSENEGGTITFEWRF